MSRRWKSIVFVKRWEARTMVVITLRAVLAVYLILGISHKILEPSAILGTAAKLPLIEGLPPSLQRASVGVLVGVEVSLAVCLIVGRSIRAASLGFTVFLAVLTFVVAPRLNTSGCACNWSWIPWIGKSPGQFVMRNALLATLAIALAATVRRSVETPERVG